MVDFEERAGAQSRLMRALRAILLRLRFAATIGLVAAGVFAISEWTIDPELEAQNARLEAELMRIEARNGRIAADIESLISEIARLKSDGPEVVDHARKDLGMVRPGEMVYRFRHRTERSRRGEDEQR